MIDYGIYSEDNENIFQETCRKIEKIEGIVKEKLLIDVDDSLIQEYRCNENQFAVLNDTEVGAIYIRAEKDIADFLKNNNIQYYCTIEN